MTRRKGVSSLVALLGLALISSAACGYALTGRANTLPPHVRLIGIPQFVNQSSTPEIDVRLTEAVRVEFSGRGRFKIDTTESGADAVLVARITNVTLIPESFADRQASRYLLIVTASVEFKDLRDNGKVLWSSPSFQARDQYQVTSTQNSTDVTALLRTDTDAMDRLAKAFARTLVTAIMEAF